jgi:hypothetical protein
MAGWVVVEAGTVVSAEEVVVTIEVVVVAGGGCVVVGAEASSAHAATRSSTNTGRYRRVIPVDGTASRPIPFASTNREHSSEEGRPTAGLEYHHFGVR